MVKAYEANLSDFTPDPKNANQGTERGAGMIRDSLKEVGAGRSLVADKNNILPAGNKTREAAMDVGIEKVVVVETEGDQLVIVKRTDWDINDGAPDNPARRYAYFDNRTGEINMLWDGVQVAADVELGVDLSTLFLDWELDAIIAAAEDVIGEGFDGPRENNSMNAMCNQEFGAGPYIRLEIGEIMTSIPKELYERVFTMVQEADSQQEGIVAVLEAAVANWDH